MGGLLLFSSLMLCYVSTDKNLLKLFEAFKNATQFCYGEKTHDLEGKKQGLISQMLQK